MSIGVRCYVVTVRFLSYCEPEDKTYYKLFTADRGTLDDVHAYASRLKRDKEDELVSWTVELTDCAG